MQVFGSADTPRVRYDGREEVLGVGLVKVCGQDQFRFVQESFTMET